MTSTMSWVRSGSLAAMVAVPALAVAFLGIGGLHVPTRFNVGETREFNLSGQNLAAPWAAQAGEEPIDLFLTNWQNTVRTPPSPRL